MSKGIAGSPVDVCHAGTCQNQRVKGFRLCKACLETSERIGLKIQTYDESLAETPDLGIPIMMGRTNAEA